MAAGFPPAAATPPALSDSLRARGIALRPAATGDLPFLRDLFADFRAIELALTPWSEAQKRAFTDDQFRLQHLHFTRHHARANFWVTVQALPLGPSRAIGRLYLDRSTRDWQIIDIGFAAESRGQGLGHLMLKWIQQSAAAAEAGSVRLQVASNNPRAHALYARLGFRDDGDGGETHQPMAWRPQVS
ncbi:GNAT family N-acetyltransferase [Sphingomonas sp. M1-B02]|uniref:GNAT family N-acetyltransferase n=1 Tax=Sphingomonas sp. M1-B02 TaxID=3114300 RepID=UPI00223F4502|nr:GNAT family N-acetyltransferase [Sphingomonas sp. S6-11]UZK66218.1 GNAT family N-acetyltransferase [Sphingomonas sp. S6-11]